jgi:hypothetical protein
MGLAETRRPQNRSDETNRSEETGRTEVEVLKEVRRPAEQK